MTQTTARIKKAGKHFEILVDMDKALQFRKGENVLVDEFLEIDRIFSDAKKGQAAGEGELQSAFGTDNIHEIAKKIIKDGEVLVTQEHRSAEQEQKFKQIVDFLTRNAVDAQSGNPITSERIKSVMEDAGVNVKNLPVEKQIKEIMDELRKVIPIKLEMKRVKITIPASYTGQAYGVVNEYKESENWKDTGDLEVVVAVPSGMIMGFYDKLNSITHGAALTEER